VPDHSTFSKNRHGRFRDSDLLRQLFETVLSRCIREGLVGGEGFAVDGSLIKADASRQKSVETSEWATPEEACRAVEEYLAVLDDAAFGAATPVVPKFISPSDPASRWTGAEGGLAYEIMAGRDGRASKRQRKKVEMLFAHLKRILKLDRLRLRGPNGARDEFHLAATAQNLRKMAKLIPMPELAPA
jgi:hypothetical protein